VSSVFSSLAIRVAAALSALPPEASEAASALDAEA
jgi:hypothetical protein